MRMEIRGTNVWWVYREGFREVAVLHGEQRFLVHEPELLDMLNEVMNAWFLKKTGQPLTALGHQFKYLREQGQGLIL